MKSLLSVVLGVLTCLPAARALDHVLIIGDSLSKEYEVEGAGIGVEMFPPPSPYPKNWAELLDSRRTDYFDFGDFDGHSDIRAVGHDYNWSVPGSFARQWHDTYLNNPPSALTAQLSQTQVKRIVIWLGGNDVRENYGPLYTGALAPATWAAETYEDLAFVLDWVLQRRQPGVPVVLVNVPHLGATPSKNDDHPFDPVKTGRLTAALDDLNGRLSALAAQRGAGLADIYTLTKNLVGMNQLSIGGWVVTKRSSEEADSDAMFLGDGFHPNMPLQAVFAQIIVDAFNARTGSFIPRLTNREIVANCLSESANVTYDQWIASYGIAADRRAREADADGDGVSNFMEFGFDLDPVHADLNLLPRPRLEVQNGASFATLTWQPRDLTNTTSCTIRPEQSADGANWVAVNPALITNGPQNSRAISLPVASAERMFLRLKVTVPGQ